MKKNYRLILAAIALSLGVLCVSLAGCATKPPSKFEQAYFNIITNPPVISVITNVIPFNVYQTNVVPVIMTNVQGVLEIRTNVTVVALTQYQTNTIVLTNAPESYVFTPGAGAAQVRAVGTEVGNIFGVGGIVGTGIGMLFSLWGYVRSRKSNLTAVNIAQTVETMREFIKSLPNGQTYDNELVNWMQQNQANAGVLQSVIGLISQEVSNPDAKEAARQIQQIISSLQGLTPPAAKT